MSNEYLTFWLNYHIQCETYDRAICGPDGIPKSHIQRKMISENARNVRSKIYGDFTPPNTDASKREYEKAKLEAVRLVERNLGLAKEILDRLERET